MKTCPACEQEWPDDTKFCPRDGTVLRGDVENGDLVGSLVAERYDILAKLGSGGMGAVYLGEHVKMGLKVAVKVMNQTMTGDVDAIARFHREAKNAARIKHPNVCGVLDFGETPEGLIYLTMEYVEGETLTELLRREGALPPHRAAKILAQCCDALQAAHDLDIVHRDLKPDNIMISKARDGTDFVKIVDFGIAKAMQAEDGQTVTQTGFIVGTPEYMSPEQVSGEVLDGRSDNYSLALVLFRMLTGALPFKADTPQESLASRLVEEPKKLNEVAPGIEFPEELQLLIDRALARSRDGRFANAVEFGKAVEAVLSGMPNTVPEVDMEAPTHLLDSGAAASEPTPETASPAPPPPQPKRKRVPVVAVFASVVVVVAGTFAVSMIVGRDAGTAGTEETASNVADSATSVPELVDASDERGAQERGAVSQQDQALSDIEALIAEGRVRTALERLDRIRERDITNDRVNGLIESAVRQDVETLVTQRDFDGAVTTLTGYVEARPYLEHMEADLKDVHLARFDAAVGSDEWQVVGTAMSLLQSAFPRDAGILYEASIRLANEGWLAQALSAFEELLEIDASYSSREPIFTTAVATLSDGWISNIQSSARDIVGEYFIEDYRSLLIDNLNGEDDNLRLNSYQILRRHSASEFESLDLFEFHRLNMLRIANYRNRGQPFDWAVDYFLQLNDEGRVELAIVALETVLTNDSVANASAILRECQETIDRLRSATVPIDVTSQRAPPPIPSRNGLEFHFDWMDETLDGARDYKDRVSIQLEIDGVLVANQEHLNSVAELPRARDCTRLGTRWFNVSTSQPRQCTHEVLWKYRHPPLEPGEHSWTLSSSYEDSDDGKDSFEEQFSGTFVTARL